MAERFADGLATVEELEPVRKAARLRVDEVVTIRDGRECLADSVAQAAEAAWSVTEPAAITAGRCAMWNARDAFLFDRADISVGWEDLDPQRVAVADQPYVHLLRDIFGNPFQPPAIEGSRLTQEITSLALACYENRRLPSGELETVRLRILADALEEAGGFPPAILDHLRAPGLHVRGCWAVDCAVLGQAAGLAELKER